jgi:hypothetical protein
VAEAAQRDDIIIDDLALFGKELPADYMITKVASLWASADLVKFLKSLPIFYPKLHIGVSEDV